MRFVLNLAWILCLNLCVFPLSAGPKEQPPLTPKQVEELLGRVRGQTQFLSPPEYAMRGMGLEAVAFAAGAPSAKSAAGGGRREQQESDVYKFGPAGSKLVYLLNSYRGLQVVSFAEGVNKPKILGRVAPTGNYPDEMYVVNGGKELIVIEMVRGDEEYGTRLVRYDVSNPDRPVVKEVVPFIGSAVDSRLVGDILYVATHKYADDKNHGFLYSFQVGKKGLKVVSQIESELPIVGDRMKIAEVEKDGNYSYYLIAATDQWGWGWGWAESSAIEFYDLSDSGGAIKKVMTLRARGSVQDREFMDLKLEGDNLHLLVTSNYMSPSGKARVATEAFRLPNSSDKIGTHNEGQYASLGRKVMEEGLKANGTDADAMAAELAAFDKDQLAGKFFTNEKGDGVVKLMADSAVMYGDTTGQHASLQSVRYVGSRAYVFWVPANQIDPFDLIDISDLTKSGVRYMKRLQFDGWIEKTFPIQMDGRNFVLGLGYVVPATGEDSRRVPQVKLFEVTGDGKSAQIVEIDTLTLESFWANLRGLDKLFSFQMDAEGKGTVMFQVSGTQKHRWADGGKIISFDLKAQPGKIFAEGKLIPVPGSSWLKRVFRNDQLGGAAQMFSDKALATRVETPAAKAGEEAAADLSILELARNMRDYISLKSTAGERGVQVVAMEDWSRNERGVEFRLVQPNRYDAELSEVSQVLKFSGRLLGTRVVSASEVWVATEESIEKGQGQSREYETNLRIARVVLEKDQLKMVEEKVIKPEPKVKSSSTAGKVQRRFYPSTWGMNAVTELKTGGLLLASNELGIVEVMANPKGELNISKIDPTALANSEGENYRIHGLLQFDGHIYLHRSTAVEDPRFKDVALEQNEILPVTRDAGGKWMVGKPINIPGKPVAIYERKGLIVQDRVLVDAYQEEAKREDGRQSYPIHHQLKQNRLALLELNNGVATLKDFREWNLGDADQVRNLSEGLFAFSEGEQEDDDGFFPMRGPGRWMPRRRQAPTEPKFQFVRWNSETWTLQVDERLIRGFGLPGTTRVAAVMPNGTGSYYVVLGADRNGQVVSFDWKTLVPQVQQVYAHDETMTPSKEASPHFTLPMYLSANYGPRAGLQLVNGGQTFLFSAGLYGNCAVDLAKTASKPKKPRGKKS